MISNFLQKGIVQFILLYFFMAVLYYAALVIDTKWYFHFKGVSINFLVRALLTIPLWVLFFIKMKDVTFWKKLLLHLLALPLFTYLWMFIFYKICDELGIRRAQGSRAIWDFYITILFYIVQFGIFHLVDYYKKLKKQELLAIQLNELHLQSELSALKAQLNPHFLYNVFNTINAAIPRTAMNARDMVTKLSDLFRYQLKASREDWVMLQEEIDFVDKYLALEKERFGSRLKYSIYVEQDLLKNMIPPMLIQPIIENSVKHGISPLIDGGEINIRVVKSNNVIVVNVADTGKGVQDFQLNSLVNKGVGLSNTHKRLIKRFGSGLSIEKNNITGLIVSFSIPIK